MMHDLGGVICLPAKKVRGRLIWALLLGTLLGLGIGCGIQDLRLSRGSEFSERVRWAAGDTSRMLRNAHYFKLMGQPELGIKEMEEAHRRDPGNLKVADALAQYYDEMGLGARAQQIYLEALALAPDNPALHNNLCFSYYQAGNWSQAETCFRQTITRQPNNQAARNNLGLVLCRQGRQEEARRLWQEAEGEAIAAENLSKALAALGIAEETRYAQAIQPQAAGRLSSRHSPPGGSHGNDPVTATTRWRPLQAPAPSVNPAIETATRAPVPPPEAAADKLAATLPLKRLASDSRAGEIPAPQTVEVQAGPAAPPAQQPAPGLVAPDPPAQSLPPRREMAAAPPLSPPRDPVTPASPVQAASQPVQADQPNPEEAAGKTALAKPQGTPRSFITARELMETNIAILNGNGIHNLAHDTRSRLHLEGYNVMAINNFRDFGVNRTVIYYQPEAERVATSLTKKFFPGAELKAMPLRADSIDVKVVLGHDLRLQQQAAAPHTHVPPL